MLDAKTEAALAAVADEFRGLFGTDLVAVALYGSAAGADFVAGTSDVNVVVVLERLSVDHLRRLRRHVAAWRRRGVATPLVIDRAFLRHAADVFPMELYDLQRQHRMLFGDDVFALQVITAQHLRYQCEHEVRGKLLRLHELYFEVGGSARDLQRLMLDSLKTFLIIMRHLNRMAGAPDGAGYDDVLHSFCRRFQCAMPVLSELLQIKLGRAHWGGDAEQTFQTYWEELQALVRVVDELPENATAADASLR
jgi:hypothetical protein